MRILKFAVVAALFVLPVSQADAAIEATSTLDISGFTVTVLTGTATPTQLPTESWFFDVSMETLGGGVTFGAGLDGAISSIGTPVANNAFPAHGSVGVPYAFADSNGSGDILAGTGTAITMASLGSPVVGPLQGMSSATDQLQVQSILTGSAGATVTFSFTADLDLELANMASTPPFGVSASSAYSIGVNGTGPNGTVNYTSSNDTVEDFSPLNTSITSNGPGVDILTVDDVFTSQVIVLPANTLVQFSISQTSAARLFALPEPTTIMVWGILGVCGGISASRRRNRNS